MMATKLTKPVRREVFACSPLDDMVRTHVVEIHPDGVRIREKRRRHAVTIPFHALMAYTPDPSRDVATRHYALTARLAPEGVIYRERGTKRAFTIPHGVAFQRAVMLTVAAEKAEKPGRKRARKRARATQL